MKMEIRTRHNANAVEPRLKQAQQELERRLLELEGAIYPEMYEQTAEHPMSLASKIEKLSETIRYNIRELETLIPSERDPAKRELYRKRLETSMQRLQELEKQGRARGAHWAIRAREARERELLLGSRSDAYDAEAANEVSAAVAENESLKHSSRGVDEAIHVGRSVLEALGTQGETIRRATDKVERVAGSLGLSSSLLRAVRRRQWGDAMIVYGGMVTITLILFFFYRWVHSASSSSSSSIAS